MPHPTCKVAYKKWHLVDLEKNSNIDENPKEFGESGKFWDFHFLNFLIFLFHYFFILYIIFYHFNIIFSHFSCDSLSRPTPNVTSYDQIGVVPPKHRRVSHREMTRWTPSKQNNLLQLVLLQSFASNLRDLLIAQKICNL